MSAGGLLASVLGGAAKSGMAMADKISSENRQNERQDGLLEQKFEREDKLLASANAREDNQISDTNKFTLDRDALNHQRSLQLARISKSGKGNAKGNANRYEQVFITDEFGNKTSAGSFDKTTGKSSLSQIVKDNPNLDFEADAYAESVIEDKSSYFSGDESDFKEFGGSRTQAKEFYKQQYLEQNSRSPNASSSPIEEVMRANPSFNKEKAQAYLKHLNQQ